MNLSTCCKILSMALTLGLLAQCGGDDALSSYPSDQATLAEGKELFGTYCSACHNFQSRAIGPNLAGVTREVPETWLRQFVRNPNAFIESGDPRAAALLEEYPPSMPAFNMLDEEQIGAILAYMHTYEQTAAPVQTAAGMGEPVSDPIPERIPPSDITLVLRQIAQAPPTAEQPPLARINKMAPMPGSGGRLFIQDLRGVLYEIKDGALEAFLTVGDYKPLFIHQPGLATGFGSFAFHPDFQENGLFYTTHTEDPQASPPADFNYADSLDVTVRWVLSEWKMEDPDGAVFSGANRELFRIDMVTGIHGVQEIAFNPTASPGDPDYGMLYIGVGDGGSVGAGHPFVVQSTGQLWGSILRIDPAGNSSKNGKYGIPPDNPYARDDDPATLGEIWARGFRNPHRFIWDVHGDGKMLASDIGQHAIEELNIILPGGNYGWAEREGTFMLDKEGDLAVMYPLPANDADFGFTYPVMQFDHDEAGAISGGYIYHGEAAPDLQGKYLFGGIVNGRVFFVDAAALELGKQAPIQELSLRLENGEVSTLRELTGNNRVDLRFGVGADEELYLFTKADGKIYRVVGDAI